MPGPAGTPLSWLQVRGRGRIVRPSDRPHCAAGGGGRAGAHLPSATAALIGVPPEQLRPGPRAPGRDPQLRAAAGAGRPPGAVCGQRGATLAGPGPPNTVGVRERPGHSEGWTAPFCPPSLCSECLRHCTPPGEGEGGGAWAGARMPARWSRPPDYRREEGASGLALALSGIRVGPGAAARPLSGRRSQSLCGKLGSAIFFLLPGRASPGAQRSPWPRPPCLSGKALRPWAGKGTGEGSRRVRRAGPPGWRPGPAGCCRPSGVTEAEQKVVFGRKVGQALRSLGRAVAVSAESARCWAGGRAPPPPHPG